MHGHPSSKKNLISYYKWIRLLNVDTPKLGSKNYRYTLNTFISHIKIFNFFKY